MLTLMAHSAYLEIERPRKKKNGIVRPGAVHLHLPLVERHFQSFNNLDENMVTVTSTRWTFSAAPKTSASLYSQDSYSTSPAIFSEKKLDRRRFAIASTPAEDGPWSHRIQVKSAAHGVFALDLKSSSRNTNFVENPGDDDNERDVKYEEPLGHVVIQPDVSSPKVASESLITTSGSALSKETTKSRIHKFRSSSKVFGKMLSRLSSHPSSHRVVDHSVVVPPLPMEPPQITISLCSPGITISLPGTPTEDVKNVEVLTFTKSSAEHHLLRKFSAKHSTWKPPRPPSPLPKSLRRQRKVMSKAPFVMTSPPPPLPPLREILSTVQRLESRNRGHSMPQPPSKFPINHVRTCFLIRRQAEAMRAP
ncbi:hypothetical protein H0H93_006999 [Arthromyces matolae]|nr:hypothetical protein H0H93_006999 [Arthromyces matolae]